MHPDRAEYPAKTKPKPLTRFTIHRKASNSNAFPALVAALIAYIEIWAGQAVLSNRFLDRLKWPWADGGSQALYTSCRAFKFFYQKHPGATLDSIQAPQDSPVPPWIPFRPPRIPPVPPRIPTVSPWESLAPMSQPAPETLSRPFRATLVLLQRHFSSPSVPLSLPSA